MRIAIRLDFNFKEERGSPLQAFQERVVIASHYFHEIGIHQAL